LVPGRTGLIQAHVGEEFVYMLKGTLDIWLGELERRHLLREGDSFWFESNVGHTAGLTHRMRTPC
jgi:quercetin dioxygenase-like cupin family protein